MTNDQYSQAKFYIQTKKYEHGLKFVNTLLAGSPDDDVLHAFVASNFFGLRKFKEAEKAISKAIGLNPLAFGHYKMASKIQIFNENPEEAKKMLDIAMGLNANDPDLYGYQSLIKTIKQDFKRALELADDGLRINPNNFECLKAKAIALSFLNRHDEAKEITKRLLSENPINAQNLFADGLVSLLKGSESSISMMSLSLEKQPNNPFIRNAYRLSLRSELPGFRQIQKWIGNVGKKGTVATNVFAITYTVFFLLCIINFMSQDFRSEKVISWLMIYLVFWNVNLAFHLLIAIPVPLYDAWLFVCDQKARDLFSATLKVKTSTIIFIIVISVGFLLYAIYFFSTNHYQIALHVMALTILIYQISYSKRQDILWTAGYLILAFLVCIVSISAFDKNIYYFITFNVIFRILSISYVRLSLSN